MPLLFLRKPQTWLLLLLLVPKILFAQGVIEIREGLTKIALKNKLEYYVDLTGGESFPYVLKHFKGIPIQNSYPIFRDSPYAHWLQFRVRSAALKNQKISLVTKGIDSLQVYVTQGDSMVYKFGPNGSHTPIFLREKVSPLLFTTLELKPSVTYTAWVRIRNVHYSLAASPFDLYGYETAGRYLLDKTLLYSVYIGSTCLILLFSLILIYFFKEKIYWYYMGCVCCALLIMFIYNDFIYLFCNRLPSLILNKNALGILSATVPVLYLLFAEQYLDIDLRLTSPTFVISRAIFAFQYLAMAVLIAWGKPLFDFRILFYLTMASLSVIQLVYLYQKIKTVQARLFLFATIPVTVTVLLETFSGLHQIPVQSIHDNYYMTTLTELLLLTGGIVYRFKENQKEKFRLENEILTIQSTTKKEITSLIADKLHNHVSSDLVVSKSKFTMLQKELSGDNHTEDWRFAFERIDSAYNAVRDLSHQLGKSANSVSLINMLLARYHGEARVEIDHQGLDPDNPINNKSEVMIFSIISEIITNAIKHARCTSINVQLTYAKPELTVIVEDNGIGFDVTKALGTGYGLADITRKVEHTLHGKISIESNSGGTVAIVKIRLK
ncbi:ATP-binding protein [Dyadobacter sp. CY261]|uniref:7TM diverse intracellular signaling domain-containing protein n=1 Tax=Dyadobacter sp. CY261 TaxID=2907203 RepID=UPI001F280942|nr:7TM diverse intracellular signaling domain-containing protein [Dyadobacter sp. CY261]MCF0070808.1 ATP-binding protein [Dyadobacter sp. CY261]